MTREEDTARRRIERAAERGYTKLSLGYLRLAEVPEELAGLSMLTKLDLSGNVLTELPEWLGRFDQLTELNIGDNQLTGLPDSIAAATGLRRLKLYGNEFTTLPPWIGELRRLSSLSIGANPLAEVPEWIGSLELLRELRLHEVGLREVPGWVRQLDHLNLLGLGWNNICELPGWIGQLHRIRRLWLHGNRLTGLPETLCGLEELSWLDLSGNRFTEFPAQISALVNLRELSISGNQLIELPDWIGDLADLRTLNVSECQLLELPESIGNLGSLRRLVINGNQITELPDSLGALSHLTKLQVGGNQLLAIPECVARLTRLSTLNVRTNRITELPESLRSLTKLRALHLGENEITELPAWIGEFTGLRGLSVNGLKLIDLPAWIGRLRELDYLNVSDNLLMSLPDFLSQLVKLTELNVRQNKLTEIPESLAALRRLKRLDLNKNQLTELPDWIGILRNLETLAFEGNAVARFPPWLGALPRLSRIEAGGNVFAELPRPSGSLRELTQIWLTSTELTEFPDWITSLTQLSTLSIGGRWLTGLPQELGNLSRLTTLAIYDIELAELPDWIRRLHRLELLSVVSTGLCALPEWIGGLTRLTTLILSNNQLSVLPESIANLSKLTVLYLSLNELTDISESVTALLNLAILRVDSNDIREIPEGLSHLSALKELWIGGNSLTRLPDSMRSMELINHLSVLKNELTEIPEWIGSLRGLTYLDVEGNRLTTLPESIAALTRLKTLDLRYNNLPRLPESIKGLSQLTDLNVHGNQISHLPDWLLDMPYLAELSTYDNPLLNPPPELAATKGAVMTFLKEHRAGATRQWVSKMLVVGEGGVGKTSTVKNLLGSGFNRFEQTTHGIRIHRFDVEHPSVPGTTMQLTTWDFGGQQIYHATHQFFLSDRSLFLLLWNNRLGWEQGRLRYWLDIIAARAPKSPVLLVATNSPASGRPVDLPDEDLRREYPQIVASLSLDNETNEGIEQLREQIAASAATLPLMGSEWPTAWLAAADAVRALPNKWVTPHKLWEAMAQAGLQDEEHQRYIAKALHELGDILFYQDDSELADTVVLRPEWVNEFISLVLDSPEVERSHGMLSRDHLKVLWDELDPSMREHFLGMMDQYDLSYRLGTDTGGQLSLVVERLPWNAPDYASRWDAPSAEGPEHEIRVMYQLNTTPPGIPTWFIARSHRFTTGIHWRTGALFTDPDGRHRALVRSYAHRNLVELAVRGPNPVNFFAVLDDGLNLTLKRYPGLSIKRMVPCPCADDASERGEASCDEVYDYEDLRNRLNRTPPRKTIECRKSGEDVYVPGLLYGLSPGDRAALQTNVDRLIETVTTGQTDLAGRIADLSGDLQRQFLKIQQRLQTALETRCPSVFAVVPARQGALKGGTYEIRLYCEEPGAWHPLPAESGVYQLSEPPRWLQRHGPYLREVVTILKHAAPFIRPILGMTVDTLSARAKADAEAMESLIDQIPSPFQNPELPRRPNAADSGLGADPGAGADSGLGSDPGSVRPAGPEERATTEVDFRALETLLERVDPARIWGDLTRIATPEGLTIYLCPEHAEPYRRGARTPDSTQIHR